MHALRLSPKRQPVSYTGSRQSATPAAPSDTYESVTAAAYGTPTPSKYQSCCRSLATHSGQWHINQLASLESVMLGTRCAHNMQPHSSKSTFTPSPGYSEQGEVDSSSTAKGVHPGVHVGNLIPIIGACLNLAAPGPAQLHTAQ